MVIDLPEPVNITIHQGATFTRVLRARNEDQTPVNLTGYSAVVATRVTGVVNDP